MTIRKFQYIIILLILLFIFFLTVRWIWNKSEFNGRPMPSKKMSTPIESRNKHSEKNQALSQHAAERADKLKTMVQTSNVPIAFWGKVIDEGGAPLSDVRVSYHIQKAVLLGLSGIGPEQSALTTCATDTDGLFQVLNIRGVLLDFKDFEKDGYELMGNQPKTFAYSRMPEIHSPNQDSPKTFIMKSSKIRSDVRKVTGKFELPWDGTPIRIDLETGQLSQSGKLLVTSFRNAVAGQVRGFDWNLSLRIEGGSLQQEVEKEVVFIAPDNGYSGTWQSGSTADEKSWKSGYHGNVYYLFNGKYGRLNLEIYADTRAGEMGLHVDGFTNHSGGRDTEERP